MKTKVLSSVHQCIFNCARFYASLHIISQYSDFAILAAKTSARKDYRSWIFQHKSWNFSSSVQDDGNISENHIALIVGRFGEDKGAVQCAPMHF